MIRYFSKAAMNGAVELAGVWGSDFDLDACRVCHCGLYATLEDLRASAIDGQS